MTLRAAFIQKWILETFFICCSFVCASNESLWLGKILTDAVVAKQYAYENNRPLLVEVGQGQADAVERLFRESGFLQTFQRRDYAGIPRVVGGCKP